MADYAWGEGGLDQIVTQLLNQFEGGSTPVDAKLLPNLPMTSVEQKHVDSGAQCTTCMETFKKVTSLHFKNYEIMHLGTPNPLLFRLFIFRLPKCFFLRLNLPAFRILYAL